MAAGDTDVKVCAHALLLLGENEISSFSEGTTQAGICEALFPQIRDQTLSMYPWSFSLKKVQLAESAGTDPVNEWQNSFPMPSDSLTGVPRALFNSALAGASPLARGWEMLGSDIVTDYETVVIDYQFRPLEAEMPTYFIQLLKYVMAAHLAEPITDQITKAQHWLQVSYGLPMEGGRGGAFRQAASTDGMGEPSSMFLEYPLTDVRH
ncbi:uncharacterized protein METZ01_LOCUS299381 [marine metagenome]|uniref:Uncharacterized protein n=1 Tax=marine metagenome TaxID=408172 RepID=A0A382MFL1_9ZZZZ